MITCPKCGAQQSDGALFCTECGTALPQQAPGTSGGYEFPFAAAGAQQAAPQQTAPEQTAPQQTAPQQTAYTQPGYAQPAYSQPNYPQPGYTQTDYTQTGYTQRPAASAQTGYASRELTAAELPPRFKPLGAWAYFGYSLLFNIPIVGFICMIIFACGGTQNVNLRSYARSFFCWLVIALILILILSIVGVSAGLLDYLDYML